MKTLFRYSMIALMLATISLCSLAQEEKKEGGKVDADKVDADKVGADREPEKKAAALAEIPSSLEEMLAHALKSNPDILVAEADLYHAQAVAKQTRLEVSRMIVEAFLQRKTRKENVEIAKRRYSDMKMVASAGGMNQTDLFEFQQTLTAAEAALAEIEAELRSLTGVDPVSGRRFIMLEEALDEAFESNGEIMLAQADLVRMDTRLNRMRLQVIEEVTITFQTRRSLELALDNAHRAHQRAQERVKQGIIPEEERLEAFQHLIEIEAEHLRVEAHLRYLLGIGMKIRAR